MRVIATNPEQEAERFLLDVIKTSPFAGKVYAVGGYVRCLYSSLV